LKDKSNEDGMPEENIKSTEGRQSPAYEISSYAILRKQNVNEVIHFFETRRILGLWELQRNQRQVAEESCWAITGQSSCGRSVSCVLCLGFPLDSLCIHLLLIVRILSYG
jgi:hypothetical protein